jgi:hypothetical protein
MSSTDDTPPRRTSATRTAAATRASVTTRAAPRPADQPPVPAADTGAPESSTQQPAPRRSGDIPARRPLQIYSFDPMLANTLERIGPGTVVVGIPWEPLQSGPSGARVQVIDFDGGRFGSSTGSSTRPVAVFYEPINLDHPHIAIQGGLAPSESDPRFHQQMVYAVAMRTLEAYDKALGRRIRPIGGRLRLFPHAFRGDNAFYHPDLRAVLFGYFEADARDPGPNLPGQVVFTALSHDIITHEVTHALIHRVRPLLLDQTNRDVAAFHEAIADLTAILLHFRLPGVVESTIAATRADLGNPTPLVELAEQFGYATGRGRALRSTIDRPDPALYQTEMEPHARGSILVAAVFDAFLTVYRRRISDLLRLATGGSGVLPQGSLHPDLVARVSREAMRTADQVLTICLRALDYLPPVDVDFPDFLRAVVTSDRELFPTDGGGLRLAFIDAFRRRGIYPQDVVSLAEGSLVWPGPHHGLELPPALRAQILAFDTLSLDPWTVRGDDIEIEASRRPNGRAGRAALAAAGRNDIVDRLEVFLRPNAAAFELDASADLRVRAFQAMFRYDEDEAPHVDFAIQCLQQVTAAEAPGIDSHVLNAHIRRAATIIFDESGRLRRIVTKPLPATGLSGEVGLRAAARLDRLVGWLETLDASDSGAPFGAGRSGPQKVRIDFASLHRGMR